jgi:hypothetical protein
MQNIMVLFPEFRYTAKSSGKTVPAYFRLMRAHGQGLYPVPSGGFSASASKKSYTFNFAANPYSTYFEKGGANPNTLTWTSAPSGNKAALASMVHYTPLWYLDTSYPVYAYMLDGWTPSGMLSAADNSQMAIKGNLWDDWHVSPVWP